MIYLTLVLPIAFCLLLLLAPFMPEEWKHGKPGRWRW
jgi:hypothetical protein